MEAGQLRELRLDKLLGGESPAEAAHAAAEALKKAGAFAFPHYQILPDGKSVGQIANEAAAALEKAGLKTR